MRRERRGVLPRARGRHRRELRLRYRGLDGEERWTSVEWSDPPADDVRVTWFGSTIGCCRSTSTVAVARDPLRAQGIRSRRQHAILRTRRAAEAAAALEDARRRLRVVEGSSERFNRWVRRSAADLRMLAAPRARGEYPYAGVPWFSTPFGRDGIITALQTALGAIRSSRAACSAYLAATQADDGRHRAGRRTRQDPARDAQQRNGAPRRGAVRPLLRQRRRDAALRGARRRVLRSAPATARSSRRLWPHVERALEWIDRYGDRDGDGFVEYARRSPTGLVQQGWKDSQDSVFHADGTLADAPIALCEVQAYVYAAQEGARRRWRMRSGPTRARAICCAAGRGAPRGVRDAVLVRGGRDLCARARRTKAAVPRACVERGTLPVRRDRLA